MFPVGNSAKALKFQGSEWKICSIIAQLREMPRWHFAVVEVLRRAQLAKYIRRTCKESGVGPQWLWTGKTSLLVTVSQPHYEIALNTWDQGSQLSSADHKSFRDRLVIMARSRCKNLHRLMGGISSQHPPKIKNSHQLLLAGLVSGFM